MIPGLSRTTASSNALRTIRSLWPAEAKGGIARTGCLDGPAAVAKPERFNWIGRARAGAENALYELSIDSSIESGSTAPFYIINSQIK